MQELSQKLESIELKLKKMEDLSVEFMAYNPTGETCGYKNDTIANGINGKSKPIENSNVILIY